MRTLQLAVLIGWIFWGTAGAGASDRIDFSNDVFPIFEKYCIACHAADDSQGGLAMHSFESLMRGGEEGPVLTPGAASSSRLLQMVLGRVQPVMPPDDAEGPNADELEMLAAWIDQGAVGPDGSQPPRRQLRVPQIPTSSDSPQPTTALAINVDGIRALASFGKVSLVDAEGVTIKTLPPQPGKVNSLAFSRSGDQLVVGSGVTGLYGRAAIYDVASGEALGEMVGHDDEVLSAVFSADDRWVATASYDKKIILWNAETFAPVRSFEGHNGAVLSIAFSPDSAVMVSGSADETVKVWHVETGQRLDTMSQPEGEVMSVAVTPDGKFVVAGSADNRLRVWRLVSTSQQLINPLIVSRYVDESPLTLVRVTHDGTRCVVIGESGNLKVFSTSDWRQMAPAELIDPIATDLVIGHDDLFAEISLINGDVIRRLLPSNGDQPVKQGIKSGIAEVENVYVDIASLKVVDEASLRSAQSLKGQSDARSPIRLPRGADITGTIGLQGEEDWFELEARVGEMWVLETDSTGLDSRIDTIIDVRDSSATPIIHSRLQAVRDSYFTFRGKDSTQTGDFRVFAWEEMKLGEYFYASGEVNRLWLYPRGADSGFDVFPGMGSRWTYFGTSGTVHALGEPAYIVRPLSNGEAPLANGLPVFEIAYENDDHPAQTKGKDSYLLFKAPTTDKFLVRLRDTRGEGGEAYKYRLRLRPANPSFVASVKPVAGNLLRGSGRELMVTVDRQDGFEGEVTFEVDGLPEGLVSTFPITIQAGQRFATGALFAPADIPAWTGDMEPRITARAVINHRLIERDAGSVGKLTLADRGKVVLRVYPDNSEQNDESLGHQSVVSIRRGETISMTVRADRQEGFKTEVSLGKELAGRNLPFGGYVDNIGLNGLLIRENESERQFFITVDEITQLGKRYFFLTGAVDGGVTTEPIMIEVLP